MLLLYLAPLQPKTNESKPLEPDKAMYEKIFKNFLYPFHESVLKRRHTLSYLQDLKLNQWKSVQELKDSQWSDLRKLLAHAYENTSYYKNLLDDLNLAPARINNYEDFQKIPICSRQDIVAHRDRMIAENYRNKVSHKSTGGSTGTPLHFALDQNSYEWRMAATQRGYGWAHCEAGTPTLYIWGVDVGTPSRWKQLKTDLYHRAYNRKMFNCFEFDETEMQRCVDYINSKKPTGIVAFTTAVYNLAQYIDRNNLDVAPVGSVITGAEKLHDYQRKLIEKAFHTQVFNTYGCREFMLIAAECEKHEGLHVTVDNLFVEILNNGKPAQPGERGEVVITDLHNYGMPFIRYRNGDIAVQGKKPCSCGRGLPLIKDIDGRKVDEIVATDGKVVSGGFFPHLMKEFDEIQKFQVIQKATDRLVVKLVLLRELSKERLEFCRSEIQKVFGADMGIEFEFVEDIPLTLTGKYRVTISEIAN